MATADQLTFRAILHANVLSAITSPEEREAAELARTEHAASIEFRKSARKVTAGSLLWRDLLRKALHHEALYITARVRAEELRKDVK